MRSQCREQVSAALEDLGQILLDLDVDVTGQRSAQLDRAPVLGTTGEQSVHNPTVGPQALGWQPMETTIDTPECDRVDQPPWQLEHPIAA